MHLAKVLQTATFRLIALYILVFATSVVVLGVTIYWITAATLERRLDARIADEMTVLKSAFQTGGLAVLITEVQARQQTRPAGSLEYLVISAGGKRFAGNLPIQRIRTGWSNVEQKESDGDVSHRRVLVTALANGVRLAIGADREVIDNIKRTILNGFASAFGAVIILGIFGGIALSFAFLKRVEAIRRTAEAIIAGDLTRRVPVHATNDDLDRLSQTLNRMLDRIAELMESLRQVSADISHDLKTPLARLRHRLEAAQTQATSVELQAAAIESAIAQVDEILAIFGALLRIAQIEAGTRRSGFRELDLSTVFATVVEAFAPAAEDAGKQVNAQIEPAIRVSGDRELLTQMIANLIENAIRHTPSGTRIDVLLRGDGDQIVGMVSDNGPGVPPEERERIFERFSRLEHSRSTPGSGLGLSLVKAVADLHGIALDVRNAEPGLRIVMGFPDKRQSEITTDQSVSFMAQS